MTDLFDFNPEARAQNAPLAERLRPVALTEFFGQEKVIGPRKILREMFETDQISSLILWGPPGCGKTSFANLVSKKTKSIFVSLSAIDTGAKELKSQGEMARSRLRSTGEKTLLFIDEIHRLNKSQQDCLLPFVERGDFILIGATTENPSFEINSALLSRCQVIVFSELSERAMTQILERGVSALEDGLKLTQIIDTEQLPKLLDASLGDGRRGLNLLERVYRGFVMNGRKILNNDELTEALSHLSPRYDKDRDQHHDTISAFIKSIRGSDPQAGLYYLARMLNAGEDPLFIARRLVVLASEDIGNADPRALQVAINVKEAVDFLGMPEAGISLSQAVTYLATAPKSNRSYLGWLKAKDLAEKNPNLPIPLAIRNAATGLMRKLGYGKDYKYAHDFAGSVSSQEFLPAEIKAEVFYEPSGNGHEKNIQAYLNWVKQRKENENQ